MRGGEMSSGFNKRDFDKLAKDIEKQAKKKLPETVSIDRDQTESQQISDLKKQFQKAGTKLSTSEARDMARKIRKGK